MGLIRNSKQVKQAIDFKGIGNDKMHPTDIDAVFEFNNEILILIEVKKINNKVPLGQKLVLERICDSWHTKKSIVIVVHHNFKNDEIDIPLKKCYTKKIYYKKQWHKKNEPLITTLKKLKENWKIEKMKII
jgi:16S rRNA C1402 (ribose-2'-O) methylase RsmI